MGSQLRPGPRILAVAVAIGGSCPSCSHQAPTFRSSFVPIINEFEVDVQPKINRCVHGTCFRFKKGANQSPTTNTIRNSDPALPPSVQWSKHGFVAHHSPGSSAPLQRTSLENVRVLYDDASESVPNDEASTLSFPCQAVPEVVTGPSDLPTGQAEVQTGGQATRWRRADNALRKACLDSDKAAMLLALTRGADLGPDRLGKTALHYAARAGLCEGVLELLDRGLDPNVADSSGGLAIDEAEYRAARFEGTQQQQAYLDCRDILVRFDGHRSTTEMRRDAPSFLQHRGSIKEAASRWGGHVSWHDDLEPHRPLRLVDSGASSAAGGAAGLHAPKSLSPPGAPKELLGRYRGGLQEQGAPQKARPETHGHRAAGPQPRDGVSVSAVAKHGCTWITIGSQSVSGHRWCRSTGQCFSPRPVCKRAKRSLRQSLR